MNTYTEQHAISYHGEVPAWLVEFCAVPEMQRLRGVGMNCGCEYTSFPRFRGLPRYSRFRHSVGVCLITWHFTGSIEQALAALFHDISTPSFAHTVDFLHGDYLRQEYTEGRTAAMDIGTGDVYLQPAHLLLRVQLFADLSVFLY